MRLNNYTVPNKDLLVSGSFEFNQELLAGETSGTENSLKGIKPKTFSVTLRIAYDEPDLLTGLVQVASAMESQDQQKIYDIVCPTVNAFNVRRVIFNGTFSAEEEGDIEAWKVSFSIQEYHSTSEKFWQQQELQQSEAVAMLDKYLLGNMSDPMFRDLLGYTNGRLR